MTHVAPLPNPRRPDTGRALVIAADGPSEITEIHTRLLKCALCIEESRAYWNRIGTESIPHDAARLAEVAFEQSWFGAKSMPWVKVLTANLCLRFDAHPQALRVLARWRDMRPEVRRLICHWHLQLTDPLYRAFTGEFLVRRRAGLRSEINRYAAVRWVEEQGPGRWTASTRTQFATRLLSCALAAGLVKGSRDPRPLAYPHVPDDALAYLMGLLRTVRFAGTLVSNPYLTSVGLDEAASIDRLGKLDVVSHRRLGDVHDFEWRYDSLEAWAEQHMLGGPS